MKRILPLLTLLLLFFVSTSHSQTRVLFLGNSYTNYHNLSTTFRLVALSQGDTVVTGQNTPGGFQLIQHVSNNTSVNLIAQGNWDFVVIQEQSQKPSFSPAQVANDVFPYARQLDSLITLANPCTETVFYMTWGRKNGDQTNCANYPPLCTYAGMQGRLRSSYLQMANDNDALVAPIGVIWKLMRQAHPNIELYNPDESHPSVRGSYLAACAFYATMFRKSPIGAYHPNNVDSSHAAAIQQMVHQVVFDSLDMWNIGEFDPAVSGNFGRPSASSIDLSGIQSNPSLTDSVKVYASGGMVNDSIIYSGPTIPQSLMIDSIWSDFRIDVFHNCTAASKDSSLPYQPSVGISDPSEIGLIISRSEQGIRVDSESPIQSIEIFDLSGMLIQRVDLEGDMLNYELDCKNSFPVISLVKTSKGQATRIILH